MIDAAIFSNGGGRYAYMRVVGGHVADQPTQESVTVTILVHCRCGRGQQYVARSSRARFKQPVRCIVCRAKAGNTNCRRTGAWTAVHISEADLKEAAALYSERLERLFKKRLAARDPQELSAPQATEPPRVSHGERPSLSDDMAVQCRNGASLP